MNGKGRHSTSFFSICCFMRRRCPLPMLVFHSTYSHDELSQHSPIELSEVMWKVR